ncbi:MAG TPA: hypothetical protein VK083_13725 [Nocardia sp.]|uniref:hypothetical protein n=1 Tax=Nocardia TaxID=1817 RepID=UPI002454281D|nr:MULTISPECIES: hypothetical protein [Nocardia]HLS77840.1 hypothetical protein [Nocardia sp.]
MSHPAPAPLPTGTIPAGSPPNTKVCVTEGRRPSMSLFLVPEPLMPGGVILHALEQDDVRTGGEAPPDPRLIDPDRELIDAAQETATPPYRTVFSTYDPRPCDPDLIRAVLRDHLISDPAPSGLDIGDRAEVLRLATLPEHRIGMRRVEDFQVWSVRQAMLAVYRHFRIDQRAPLVYHGFADPGEGWFALRAADA